jgi:aspartate racemase
MNLQPVPIGNPGELYIGGSGLARGYLNRPALTAEKFIKNPFMQQAGSRLYKTGDLARYLPDGNVQFLGRSDDQVKIRGFRIEPGEIEAALCQHAAVKEIAVVSREDAAINGRETGTDPSEVESGKSGIHRSKSLVAYVVRSPEHSPTVSELRGFLKEKLPDYMIPSVFVFLNVLPRSPNGKLDRKALPAPDRTETALDKNLITPRDALERDLAKIWGNILGIRPIEVRDNFFEIGGHSLLAVRLFAEIEKNLGRRLPLANIFRAPTIEQLARILRQEELSTSQFSIWSAYPSSVVPFQPNGSKPPLFWLNWGPWDFRLPRYLGLDQPVYGLQHQSQDGHRARYTTIEDIATYYIRKMRALQAKGPYFLGGLCIGGMVAFEMAQQLQKQGEEVALLVLLDPSNPRHGELSSAPQRIPSLLSHVIWFRNKVHRHLRELAPLGPQEKLSYALVRVQGKIMGLREKVSWIGRRVLCEVFGYPLPSSLRTHYIVSVYGRARRAYVPQLYRGRVILFKTQGRYRNDQSGWEDLVAEGLEIQELDTDHDNVFREPYVRTFAQRLNTRLTDDQTNLAKHRNSTVDLPTYLYSGHTARLSSNHF